VDAGDGCRALPMSAADGGQVRATVAEIYRADEAHRDSVNRKVLSDLRMAKMMARQGPAFRREAHGLRRVQGAGGRAGPAHPDHGSSCRRAPASRNDLKITGFRPPAYCMPGQAPPE